MRLIFKLLELNWAAQTSPPKVVLNSNLKTTQTCIENRKQRRGFHSSDVRKMMYLRRRLPAGAILLVFHIFAPPNHLTTTSQTIKMRVCALSGAIRYIPAAWGAPHPSACRPFAQALPKLLERSEWLLKGPKPYFFLHFLMILSVQDLFQGILQALRFNFPSKM